MIFAAGLGTRLQPLTNHLPKALVKLNKKPLVQILIEKLIKEGYDEIIINVHHFSKLLIDFIRSHQNFGIRIIISDESGQLLDTGGGLKKASWFFDDNKPFLVHNVDVLSNINLSDLMNYHKKNKALATLAVKKRSTSRYLHLDDHNRLCGWENIKTGERIDVVQKEHATRFAFSGIHIIDPKLLQLLDEEDCFSIINVYLKLAGENRIIGYDHTDGLWLDVGNKENLQKAEKIFL